MLHIFSHLWQKKEIELEVCLFQKGPIIVQKVQFQSVNVWCLLCYVHIYEQLWSFAFLLDKLKMKKYVLGSLPFLHS